MVFLRLRKSFQSDIPVSIRSSYVSYSTACKFNVIISFGLQNLRMPPLYQATYTSHCIVIGSTFYLSLTVNFYFLLAEADLQQLSLALKVLSETEKQLRTSKNQMTWLTVALLQLNSVGCSSSDVNDSRLCVRTIHPRGEND